MGVDLAGVADIAESIAAHGERYLRRVYTAQELRDCAGRPRQLGARFAAKEATMKALGHGGEAIPWTAIGVQLDAAGRESIILSGAAAELARARGCGSLALSIAHGRRSVAAIVVAQREPLGACHSEISGAADKVEVTAPMIDSTRVKIRDVLARHARLPVAIDAIADEIDLFQAGMTSHASVDVMLALEDAFDIEFPDAMLKRSVFETIGSIAAAIAELERLAA